MHIRFTHSYQIARIRMDLFRSPAPWPRNGANSIRLGWELKRLLLQVVNAYKYKVRTVHKWGKVEESVFPSPSSSFLFISSRGYKELSNCAHQCYPQRSYQIAHERLHLFQRHAPWPRNGANSIRLGWELTALAIASCNAYKYKVRTVHKWGKVEGAVFFLNPSSSFYSLSSQGYKELSNCAHQSYPQRSYQIAREMLHLFQRHAPWPRNGANSHILHWDLTARAWCTHRGPSIKYVRIGEERGNGKAYKVREVAWVL